MARVDAVDLAALLVGAYWVKGYAKRAGKRAWMQALLDKATPEERALAKQLPVVGPAIRETESPNESYLVPLLLAGYVAFRLRR